MIVDWTINIGNILTAVGFLVGGLFFVFTIRSDVNSIKSDEAAAARRLESVEGELSKMTQVMLDIARQDERMKSFEWRLAMVESNLTRRGAPFSEV